MLSSKGIDYEYFNIRTDLQAKEDFEKIKTMLIEEKHYEGPIGVPAFVIGDEVHIGFEEAKVLAFLEKNI